MNQGASWQAFETCSKAALLVSLLVSGCGTALVVFSVGAPSQPESLRLDYHFEISVMTAILNIGLPLAVLAALGLACSAVRARVFHRFTSALGVVAFVGVFASALAAWTSLVSLHGPGINLWSQIWWSLR